MLATMNCLVQSHSKAATANIKTRSHVIYVVTLTSHYEEGEYISDKIRY